MNMTINYTKAGRVEWSDFWKGSFEEARTVAINAVQFDTWAPRFLTCFVFFCAVV